ncbi:MAG: hypothetical protein JWN31_345, partial [Frankiales bacterium]|nr:hypothetical protein [Frankiales bacterium]
PADWVPVTNPQRCYVDASNRCTHSTQSPEQLTATLIRLLDGHALPHCDEARALFPCPVAVLGTVNGYLAIAQAEPDFYYPNQHPPAGATKFQKRPRSPTIYLDGTRVTIFLVPDRSILPAFS